MSNLSYINTLGKALLKPTEQNLARAQKLNSRGVTGVTTHRKDFALCFKCVYNAHFVILGIRNLKTLGGLKGLGLFKKSKLKDFYSLIREMGLIVSD